MVYSVGEEYPLKQGLKRKKSSYEANTLESVEEEHPLKQGLKQKYRERRGQIYTVGEEHSLKQGLKHKGTEFSRA